MKLRSLFTQTLLVIFSVATFFGLVAFINNQVQEPVTAYANENCTNATSTTPVWNPFPLNLTDPNPQPNGTCTDIPMISHWPIQANNPRTLTYNSGDTVTAHLYYNNGARVDAANTLMSNPRARLELTQLSATQYRLRSFLSGTGNGNSVTANSSQTQYGGDIIINIPNDHELQPIRRNTLWYPQAPQRLQAFESGQPVELSLNIDNNIDVQNPLLSPNGFQIYTPTDGSIANQASAGLQAGFDESGYFLTAWNVVPINAPTNNPPQLPGQEITIIRGDSGSFTPLNGTDPENDIPLTYTPNNLPSFCTYNSTTLIISCDTNAQTPVRTTFTVTPTDSRGLVGTPGTFIVNVIDPGLALDKTCVELGTTTPCASAQLEPGDSVTYTIVVSNSGEAPARNVRVEDDYDEDLLENLRNINQSGVLDESAGTINWNLGSINSGNSVTLTYDATIVESVSDGTVIDNIAVATADGLPPVEDTTSFPIGVNIPVLSQSDKVCFERGTSVNCDAANLTIGDQVSYFINVRNTGNADALNVVVTDTYDRTRLNSITNVQPNGTVNEGAGTITWQLGTIAPGETRTLTFDATISTSVSNGAIIINRARITADNLPPQEVSVDFPVGLPPADETPRSGGVAFFLVALGLLALGAGVYYYRKSQLKTAPGFTPVRSKEVSLDESEVSKESAKASHKTTPKKSNPTQ